MTARTAAPPSQIRLQLQPFRKRRRRQWLRPQVLSAASEGFPGAPRLEPIPDPHRYAQNVLEVILLGLDPADAEGIDPYAL